MARSFLTIQLKRRKGRNGGPDTLSAHPCYLQVDDRAVSTIAEPIYVTLPLGQYPESTVFKRVLEHHQAEFLRIVPPRPELLRVLTSPRAAGALVDGKTVVDQNGVTIPLNGYAGPVCVTVRPDGRLVLCAPLLAWKHTDRTDDLGVHLHWLSLQAGSLNARWLPENRRLEEASRYAAMSSEDAAAAIATDFREKINPKLEDPLVTGGKDPLLWKNVYTNGSPDELERDVELLAAVAHPDEEAVQLNLAFASKPEEKSTLLDMFWSRSFQRGKAREAFELFIARNPVVAPKMVFKEYGSAVFRKNWALQQQARVISRPHPPSAHERIAAMAKLSEIYGEAFDRIYAS